MRQGAEGAWVVSCYSWQAGFDPREKIASIEGSYKTKRQHIALG